jgi:small subunit ribosomal protein S6
MRIYELIFIVKPDLPEEGTQAAIEQVKTALTDGGATLDKVDEWGKRRLAYRVQGYTDGYYVFIQYSADDKSTLPREVERRLRVADDVIKFMTIRIDEELQRLEKLKKRRDKRAANSPQRSPRPSGPRGSSPGAPPEFVPKKPKVAEPAAPEPKAPAAATPDAATPVAAAPAVAESAPAESAAPSDAVSTDDAATS